MSLAVTLHVLAAVVWVGGMFFAFLCLRPAALGLDLPLRLRLWSNVLSRFFRWVWASAVVLLASGLWLVAQRGGFKDAGPWVHLMAGGGLAMMAIAAHAYFAPYKRLKRLVARHDWHLAAKQLNQIRVLIATNLVLGLLVVAVAASGPYWR